MKEIIGRVAFIFVFASTIFASGYFKWWRCGEMFPHAQFACFVWSGK